MQVGLWIKKMLVWCFIGAIVAAYAGHAWHNPLLHHHHDPCCESGESHLGEEEAHCQLCDVFFFYDLPEEHVFHLKQPSVVSQNTGFGAYLSPSIRMLLSYSLRGPPVYAC
jgi:hypothetical protein